MAPPPGDDIDERLVIALDFGTTFSGIAYAFANGRNPEVISIMDWPGLGGYKQPKIPTTICYDPVDNSKFTWGAEKHKGSVIQGVKLLLDPDQPKPFYLPKSTAKADMKRLGKTPEELSSDLIRAMFDHAMKKIASGVPSEYLEMCEKVYVLTVPAAWSDKAKDSTLQAAMKAGVWPINLIKEPEAAALYTLHELKDRSLAVGDSFIICDCGGGTVDLISYEISKLAPLELKELVPSKGGMAGSLGLNMRFESEVRDLVGEEEFIRLRKTTGYEFAMKHFNDTVKVGFRGNPDEEYHIPFPQADLEDDPANNLKRDTWSVKGFDVKAIFDPLVADIERMVQEQVNLVTIKHKQGDGNAKAIKAILLVGGFGQSDYLKLRLELNHDQIQVIQPHGAWASIVKGAVLSQLQQEATVVSSLAPRHYGVEASCTFTPGVDDGQPKYWSSSHGEWRVSKMKWYIHHGEELMRDQVIKFPFITSIQKGFKKNDLVFTSKLSQSGAGVAPSYPSGMVTTNCTLIADLRSANRKSFTKRLGADILTYYDVHYDLVVKCKPAMLKFSLEMNGKEMGSVEAKYA